MSIEDFKKMFFTYLGRNTDSNKETIYKQLLPIIVVIDPKNNDREMVSIAKLTCFIDFFNYVPFVMSEVKHKNESSDDL